MNRNQLIEQLYDLALREYERHLFNVPPVPQNIVNELFVGKIYSIARTLRELENKRGEIKNVRNSKGSGQLQA